MLNDKVLEQYINNFYGHGNLNSDYWFISLEEGGTYSEQKIQKRLDIWKRRGCRQLEDCKSFHLEFGTGEWFGISNEKPINVKIQPTWKIAPPVAGSVWLGSARLGAARRGSARRGTIGGVP